MLEEAADPTAPLLERLKFAIIVSTNLDEFFMVRVAALQRAIEEGDIAPDPAGLRPASSWRRCRARAHEMVDAAGPRAGRARSCPAWREHGVRLAPLGELDELRRARRSPATSRRRCCPR